MGDGELERWCVLRHEICENMRVFSGRLGTSFVSRFLIFFLVFVYVCPVRSFATPNCPCCWPSSHHLHLQTRAPHYTLRIYILDCAHGAAAMSTTYILSGEQRRYVEGTNQPILIVRPVYRRLI